MSCYKDIKLKYKQYEKIKELAKKMAALDGVAYVIIKENDLYEFYKETDTELIRGREVYEYILPS
jgi:chromosome condensin MukBEF MukE localization factor